MHPKGQGSFHVYQNASKGCQIDHLDDLGHFLFGFGATGKIYEGW